MECIPPLYLQHYQCTGIRLKHNITCLTNMQSFHIFGKHSAVTAVWVQVAFSSFTNIGPVMALAIAVHNIPEVSLLSSAVF